MSIEQIDGRFMVKWTIPSKVGPITQYKILDNKYQLAEFIMDFYK